MANVRLFLTSFLVISTSTLLFADEESLSHGSFRQMLNTNPQWMWNQEVNGFFGCTSESIVFSNQLNTTGIHEVYLEVVFKIAIKGTDKKSAKDKSALPIVVIGDGEKKVHYGKGRKFGKGRKASVFIPLRYKQTQFGIKHDDDKYCTLLWSLTITYKYCKNATFDSLVQFPRTNAPDEATNSLKVLGTCDNGNNQPVAYCKRNGEWWYNETLPCKCKTNQVPTEIGCFDLSRVIQNFDALRISDTEVLLSWTVPDVDIPYKVKCLKCHGNVCQLPCSKFRKKLSYNSRDKINGKIISGLEANVRYMFNVVPDLGAFNMSQSETIWSKNATVNVLPGKVRNVTIKYNDTGNIILSWQPPANHKLLNIFYNILCDVLCISDNCSNTCTDLRFTPSSSNLIQTYTSIRGLRSDGAEYHFRIYAMDKNYRNQSAKVQWNFESVMFYDSFKIEELKGDKNVNVVDVVIGVSALVVVVVIAVTLTIWYNKRRASKHLVHSDHENNEFTYSCETPLTSESSHYVDPADYETMNTLLQKFNKKLNDKHLKTNEVIGEGEFGVVCRGYLTLPSQPQTVVAVKCLRAGLSAKIRRDFLAEASVMGQFDDPNIVSLHGVVVKRTIVKIVMEYMSNGSLDTYLVKNNARLTTLQLLGMARGIASGMKYLSGRNFIHRDLAARNILVDQNLCCKVSDFGLTRELCTTSNYETTGGKIPIRWTAPEVIKCKKAFFASDVWSFGVVLWEIMAFGQRPYWDWDNFQVMQEIESGYRLPAPPKCPKSVHGLMLDCWERERTDRPQFSCIVDRLDEWIRSPETIDKSPTLSRNRSSTVEDKKCPIQRWLSSIKMARYRTNFIEAGYRELHQVSNLTEDDLLTMGIKLVGHRHKIYQSITQISNFNNDVGTSVSSDASADVNSDVSCDVNNSVDGRSL